MESRPAADRCGVSSVRRIAFVGIEPELEEQLRTALSIAHPQLTAHSCESLAEAGESGAHLVFGSFVESLDALAQAVQPAAPVVVVSRLPETHEYLQAMEAGAFDYCTAPFERSHMEWLLDRERRRREEIHSATP